MFKNIAKKEILNLRDEVTYIDGQVASKTIVQNKNISMTLFAFAAGEGLSAHSAAGDALVQILDGEAKITIGTEDFILKSGDSIVLPANKPHALEALERFKMFLVVVQPE